MRILRRAWHSQFARALSDSYRLVRNSFQIRAHFHGRDYVPQIGRHRLKTHQDLHSVIIDLLLQLIDLQFIGNGHRAELNVAIKQTSHRVLQIAIG